MLTITNGGHAMRTKMLACSAVAALGLLNPVIAEPATGASAKADPALVWSYDDPPRDDRQTVDALRTQLDLNTEDYYRIRVYGRDFIKNKTDLLRLWFDTDRADAGPEYRFGWYMGRSPGRPVGQTHLKRVEDWESPNTPQHSCPDMRHQVSYARDVLTVLIPRGCLRQPDQLRWSGYVAWVTARDPETHQIDGHFDYFPTYHRFPGFWAG